MSLRAVLIDDERLARATLRRLIEGSHPEVEIVGEADSVEAAVKALETLQPDVIFLDIQMPGGTGFDLFQRTEVKARVIFVTAYDEHALRAFDVHALDYLLKPVAPARLAAAIAKLAAPASAPAPSDAALGIDDLVCLPVTNGLKFFHVRDITHITAADDYAELHFVDGGTLLSGTPMRVWEERLPDAFVRVHRSAITNVAYVETVTKLPNENYIVVLRGVSTPISMSRRHASALKDRLGRNLR